MFRWEDKIVAFAAATWSTLNMKQRSGRDW